MPFFGDRDLQKYLADRGMLSKSEAASVGLKILDEIREAYTHDMKELTFLMEVLRSLEASIESTPQFLFQFFVLLKV